MPARPGAGRPRKDPLMKRGEGDRAHEGKKSFYERDVAMAPPGMPIMPSRRMSTAAQDIWLEIVPQLAEVPELMSTIDGHMLEDYCECRAQKMEIEHGMYDEAEAAVKTADPGKERIARAAVYAVYQNTLDKMRMRENALRTQMGMTPLSRSSLKVGPVRSKIGKPDNASPMEDVFFDGNMRPV